MDKQINKMDKRMDWSNIFLVLSFIEKNLSNNNWNELIANVHILNIICTFVSWNNIYSIYNEKG